MVTKDHFQLNNGTCFIAPFDNPTQFVELAGIASFDISLSMDVKDIMSHNTPASGVAKRVSMFPKVEGSIKVQEIDAKNFLLATNGKITSIPAGTSTFTSESVFKAGDVIVLGHTDVSEVIVKDSVTDTVLPAANYTLRAKQGSLTLKGTIPANFKPEVSYSYAAQYRISMFNGEGQSYTLRCETYNQAQGGTTSLCHLYKVEFSPIDNFSFIGEDFTTATLKFTAYMDSTQPADSVLGQFGYITLSE